MKARASSIWSERLASATEPGLPMKQPVPGGCRAPPVRACVPGPSTSGAAGTVSAAGLENEDKFGTTPPRTYHVVARRAGRKRTGTRHCTVGAFQVSTLLWAAFPAYEVDTPALALQQLTYLARATPEDTRARDRGVGLSPIRIGDACPRVSHVQHNLRGGQPRGSPCVG